MTIRQKLAVAAQLLRRAADVAESRQPDPKTLAWAAADAQQAVEVIDAIAHRQTAFKDAMTSQSR